MQGFKIRKIITKIVAEKQEKKKRKHPVLFWIVVILGVLFVVGCLSVFLFLVFLLKDLPSVESLNTLNFAQSTLILDREGNELYSIHGEENRKVVSLQQLPDSLVEATLAIEDAHFFEHKGFDLKGILRAAWQNLRNSDQRSGGSTITQQFIKNTFLTREKTYIRKLKELILAVQLENNFGKEKIVEMYLNSIPYGSNAYGAESAAETFFGKTASNLTLAESAVLAAMPQAPSYYSPYGQHKYSEVQIEEENLQDLKITSEQELLEYFPEAVQRGLLGKMINLDKENAFYVRGRADLVLLRMREVGYISDMEKQQAWEELQTLEFRSARANIKAPHFVMFIKEELERKYGKEVIERGGLRVYTTLDPRLQKIAEEEVKTKGEYNAKVYGANNAALVSIDSKTGQILAMVGSRDYWDTENDGNVNVTLSKRLPGSSFKPIAYAAAFLKGYSPATVLFDLETDFGNGYKPKNYDASQNGPVTARYALGHSLNIPAVKIGFLAGINNIYELAKSMGLNFDREADWYGGALPLGVADVRPLDMASAYNVFALNGQKIPLTPFLRVEDADGNILEAWTQPEKEQVLDEQVAYLITDVLSDAQSRGAGWNQYLQLSGRVNVAKTGTSNKKINNKTLPFDAWTIGYTPELVTVVWTGNNDGAVLNSNASGLMTAAPLWKGFMEKALEGVTPGTFVKPPGLKWVKVSTLSGLLPTKWTPAAVIKSAMFAEIDLPTKYDDTLKVVEVDKISGKLPTEYTPVGAIEKRAVVNWHSLQPQNVNWEAPVQRWVQREAKNYLAKLGVSNILQAIPKEYDDVHTAQTNQQKPELEIIAPTAFGSVSPPSIGVVTKVYSEIGLQKIEFYWDDELLDTVYQAPWRGTLKVNPKLPVGSEHTILVKAYDRVYNTTTSKLEVRIASDREVPHTEIVFPQKGAQLEAGSLLVVKTYSYDTKSDIDKVVFYVDNQKMGDVKQAPYDLVLTLPQKEGEVQLKVVAFDKAANFTEDTIEVDLVSKTQSADTELQIFTPQNNTKVKLNQAVPISFAVGDGLLTQLQELNLIQQNRETKKIQILTTVKRFSNVENGKLMTIWTSTEKGVFDFFVQAKTKQGEVKISSKVRVMVE